MAAYGLYGTYHILPGVMVYQSCYAVNNSQNWTDMEKVMISPSKNMNRYFFKIFSNQYEGTTTVDMGQKGYYWTNSFNVEDKTVGRGLTC